MENLKIPSEIMPNKDYTNSSSSEKNREIKKNSKLNDRRTNPHRSQQKLLPLPANNLLNMDEWQNSDKFPLIKTNQSVINSTINNIKKELPVVAMPVPNQSNEPKEANAHGESKTSNSSGITNGHIEEAVCKILFNHI